MKNKKGFLLGEETLKIIIAVICIGILIYFLAALYLSSSDERKEDEARSFLIDSPESLEVVIARVWKNPIGYFEEKHMPTPKGWNLFSFFSNSVQPNVCAGENCLCICDEINLVSIYRFVEDDSERQANRCDEKGVCLITSELGGKKINIEINSESWVVVEKGDNFVEVRKK